MRILIAISLILTLFACNTVHKTVDKKHEEKTEVKKDVTVKSIDSSRRGKSMITRTKGAKKKAGKETTTEFQPITVDTSARVITDGPKPTEVHIGHGKKIIFLPKKQTVKETNETAESTTDAKAEDLITRFKLLDSIAHADSTAIIADDSHREKDKSSIPWLLIIIAVLVASWIYKPTREWWMRGIGWVVHWVKKLFFV